MVEPALASMRKSRTAKARAAAIDSSSRDYLGMDRSKALLDSAGHPGLPLGSLCREPTAEKASPFWRMLYRR